MPANRDLCCKKCNNTKKNCSEGSLFKITQIGFLNYSSNVRNCCSTIFFYTNDVVGFVWRQTTSDVITPFFQFTSQSFGNCDFFLLQMYRAMSFPIIDITFSVHASIYSLAMDCCMLFLRIEISELI